MSDLIGRSGRPAEVNIDYQLQTEAMTMPVGMKRAIEDGSLWSFPISATPTGADDHFFHLANTSTEKSLVVVDISLARAATTEDVEILVASGASTSPTAITPVSWQAGATRTPDATVESGADLQLAVIATNIIDTLNISTTRTSFPNINNNTPIVLAPGGAIVLNAVTGTSAITGNVIAFEA